MQTPTEPTPTGETRTATVCGHQYPVLSAINDRGETVTIEQVYPNPNARYFQYDAPELCQACYFAAMDAKMPARITAEDLARSFSLDNLLAKPTRAELAELDRIDRQMMKTSRRRK